MFFQPSSSGRASEYRPGTAALLDPAIPGKEEAVGGGALAAETEPVLEWNRIGGTLWAARGRCLLFGLAGLVVAGLYALALPNQYVATSQLLLNPNDLRIVANDVRPQDREPSAADTYVEDQARILSSPALLRKVVAEEQLDADPEFTEPGVLASLTRRWNLNAGDDDTEAVRAAKAVETLGKALFVTRSTRSSIVDVSVQSDSPDKSAAISNSALTIYLAQDAQARASMVGAANDVLRQRLSELSGRVQRAEDDVAAFRRRSGIVTGGSGQNLNVDQVAAMDALVTGAQGRAIETSSRLQTLRALSPDGALDGTAADQVRTTNLGALMLQLATLRQQAAEMGAQLSSRHPSIISIDAKVAAARADVRAELNRQLEIAATNDREAKRSLANLQQQLEQLKGRAYALDDKSVALRELQRKADAERAVYEDFLARSRQTDELRSVNDSNTRIVSRAMPPLRKSGPQRMVIALAGAVLGGLLGAVLAFVGPPTSRDARLSLVRTPAC